MKIPPVQASRLASGVLVKILIVWCLVGAVSYIGGTLISKTQLAEEVSIQQKVLLAHSPDKAMLLPLQLPRANLGSLPASKPFKEHPRDSVPSLNTLVVNDPMALASLCKVVESLTVEEIRDILESGNSHFTPILSDPLTRLLLAGHWMRSDPETALAHACDNEAFTTLLLAGWVCLDPEKAIRRLGSGESMPPVVSLVRPQLMIDAIIAHPEIEWTSAHLAVFADRDPIGFTNAALQKECEWLGNAPLEILATDNPEQTWKWIDLDEVFLCWNYSAMVKWSAGRDPYGAFATLKRHGPRREQKSTSWRDDTADLIDLVIDGLFQANPNARLDQLNEFMTISELADYDFSDEWKEQYLGLSNSDVSLEVIGEGDEAIRAILENLLITGHFSEELSIRTKPVLLSQDATGAVALAKKRAIESVASMDVGEPFRSQWFEREWFRPLLDSIPFAAIQPVALSESVHDSSAVSAGSIGDRYCAKVAQLDPVGLANWINESGESQLIRPEIRELAARVLCRETMERFPEWAFSWAATLPDGKDRFRLATAALQKMLNQSERPPSFDIRRMVMGSPFTNGERDVLLGMLDRL